MKLKEAVCKWLIAGSSADYQQGVGLYSQSKYNPHILQTVIRFESTDNRALLKRELGRLLKTGLLDNLVQVESTIIKPIKPERNISQRAIVNDEDENYEENVPMSRTAKLAIDADSLRKQSIYHHNQLHECTSDGQRKSIIENLNRIQDAIHHKKKTIRLINEGKDPEPEPPVKKEAFQIGEVPVDPIEKMNELNRLRKRRSIRKKTMSDNPEGSPKHEKSKREWYELDQQIKKINATIKTAN